MKKFGTLTLALACACGLFVGASSARQSQSQNTNTNTGNTNTGTSTRNNNTGTSGQGMNRNTGSGMGASGRGALSSQDSKFMMTAAQGGMAEVEMARVALERGSSDAVKQYAQKMIDDHTANNQELMQLASAKGVTLPAGPDAKHRAMMQKMSRLSGAEFDHQYVMNSGVKDHEKMLKLLQDEARKGRDAEVKAFASKTIPAVEMHLKMARDMMSGMGHSNMKSGM